MPPSAPILWSAPEHEHRERTGDWFLAFGIIVLATAATSILFGNVLFALLIIAAGVTLGLIARRDPQILAFEISDKGIRTGSEFHPYEEILSFWITDELHPQLLVDTTRVLSPNLIIPLHGTDPEKVRARLARHVEQVPMKEPIAHRLLETLGL